MARDLSRRPLDFEATMREGAGLWWGERHRLHSRSPLLSDAGLLRKPSVGALQERGEAPCWGRRRLSLGVSLEGG